MAKINPVTLRSAWEQGTADTAEQPLFRTTDRDFLDAASEIFQEIFFYTNELNKITKPLIRIIPRTLPDGTLLIACDKIAPIEIKPNFHAKIKEDIFPTDSVTNALARLLLQIKSLHNSKINAAIQNFLEQPDHEPA